MPIASDPINATDILIIRRLVNAVASFNRYSESGVAEAKLLGELLGERFGVQQMSAAQMILFTTGEAA